MNALSIYYGMNHNTLHINVFRALYIFPTVFGVTCTPSCMNGGTCLFTSPYDAYCSCASGYKGSYCQNTGTDLHARLLHIHWVSWVQWLNTVQIKYTHVKPHDCNLAWDPLSEYDQQGMKFWGILWILIATDFLIWLLFLHKVHAKFSYKCTG